ncbi:MAG: fliA [Acidobacteriales bacterium]|nr:fliA [Terriglobales bacterium]
MATSSVVLTPQTFILETVERDRILLEQLSQVKFIARRIHDRLPQHVELDDLINAGVIGLMDAMKKYDPAKQVMFKSYAQFRIRGAILDSLREMDWSPRILRRKARRIEEAHRKLASELGRSATEQEVAAELGIPLHEFQVLLGELRGLDLGSIQADSEEDGPEEELNDYIPDNRQEDAFSLCAKSETKAILTKAIGELAERDRQVLALYYFEELTMKEIGVVLGVLESRVSQMHTSAVIQLRSKLQSIAPVGAKMDVKKSSRKANKIVA